MYPGWLMGTRKVTRTLNRTSFASFEVEQKNKNDENRKRWYVGDIVRIRAAYNGEREKKVNASSCGKNIRSAGEFHADLADRWSGSKWTRQCQRNISPVMFVCSLFFHMWTRRRSSRYQNTNPGTREKEKHTTMIRQIDDRVRSILFQTSWLG